QRSNKVNAVLLVLLSYVANLSLYLQTSLRRCTVQISYLVCLAEPTSIYEYTRDRAPCG
ncbi:MAG: hypothetical protein IPJ53_00105, partial [Saprospiraceae bacterium]|nr:hypothetical protein [Candidatus Vicinibacter affinis]